ncbi:MAG: hypothetical protein KatS3mg053_0334 [Candidatus Roseilinea sp.]|nr:MAG: hypothetical protein KatS3mg053_0334 [Candidatus Roseilinea sp.]
MSKPIVFGAVLSITLGLAACAPPSISAPFTSDLGRLHSEPIPATYYPTATPLPTWTPLPRPTAPPPTVAPPTATPAPAATATSEPAAPAPTLPPLPTLTFAPAPSPTPIPLPTIAPTIAAAEPRTLALAAGVPSASDSSGAACPVVSSGYDLVPIEGPPYKNNALTDYNADLRLSVIGVTPADAPPALVDYNGATDPEAPKLHSLFQPNRVPAFLRAYLRFDWVWNEGQGEPYGGRGGLNLDWPAAALELATTPGETIYPPARSPAIYSGGAIALVLFAGERELTLGYSRHDDVGAGYVVHLLNLCVDPNLVALYRAQLSSGRRATGYLPAVRNAQPIGTATGALMVAVRDRGAFLDPRSRKDWW